MSPPVGCAHEQGSSLLNLIGNTPLVRLPKIEADVPGVTLYAKAEWQNPGGSVKDRAARRMICEGLRAYELTPGRRILDATSGNTGIAYAMIGAALGYGVTLCVPENVTPERKRILSTYGAELIFTNPLEGSDGAIREARKRFVADPDRYFYPDQYNNAFNWRAHYDTTAPEIWSQTGGRLTHFVAGLGTSGTFVGTARRLREYSRDVVLASVQPDSPLHGLEGLKHMESAIVPGIYDPEVADVDLRVTTEEAYAMTRRLAREEGLLAGVSSGANLIAALKLAQAGLQSRQSTRRSATAAAAPDPAAIFVVMFPDGGDRYLSETFWDDK
jgi:cysteine synthase B